MDKIKVLVVPSDRTGVSYFRSTGPHLALERLYTDEFHVDIDYQPQLKDDEFLKEYDLIHFHRSLGNYEEMADKVDEEGKVIDGTITRCKALGIPTIMDLDDHWAPGPHHPAYHLIKNSGLDKKILENLKLVDFVTTTTPSFAEEIKRYAKTANVTVLPNAIDTNEKQFQRNLVPSERVRIGWLGGSSHLKDLSLLKGTVAKLKTDNLIDKVQFVLCGFDLRGEVTEYDEHRNATKRKITPKESVWYKYEQIFTADYSIVSPEYKEHLLEFKKGEFKGVENEPYRRVWTKPIKTYAKNYNLFDISLAPLEENLFNKVKSQLKVIEAGFHKKAIIAQNFGPYKIDLVSAYEKPKGKGLDPTWNMEANALLVDSHRNHKQWYQHLKRLITNKELRETLAENLHKTVTEKYSMEKVTEDRRNLYIDLVKNKKKQ